MYAPQVVVYGVSGYTGKLIAEFLAKKRIPFIGAGRNRERIETELASVPGIEKGEYQIAAVGHDLPSLRKLFKGARVVINVTGPFGQLGQPVVEAALAEGCHYLDTTGEQDWVMRLREEYGEKFAAKELLLCPANSWMWLAGQLAAEICMETPGIDTLDIVYAPNGAPTIASTLSFLRMICHDQYKLVNNELLSWPPATSSSITVPHMHEVLTALPWGGGCEPIWYQHDPRVRNVQVLVGLTNLPFVEWVLSKAREYVEVGSNLSPEEAEALTNKWGMEIAQTPPREDEEVNRCVISCRGRGRLVGRNVVLYATSPYLQTGAFSAEGARRLLAGSHHTVGFSSPAAAFGARPIISMLNEEALHCHVDYGSI